MKSQLILLLTRDPVVERQFRTALSGNPTVIRVSNLDDALRTVCARLHELDLVVVDYPVRRRDIHLVAAIHSCREELPIIVLTSNDKYHTAALAYANGAAACLAKPTTTEEIEILVESLGAPKYRLAAA